MQKRRKYILSPFIAAALRQGFFSRHRKTQKTCLSEVVLIVRYSV